MPPTGEVEHDLGPSQEEQTREIPEREEETPRPRRKLWKWGLIAFLVLALVAGFFWLRGRNRESTDDAQVDGHLDPISSRISGSVLKVLVDVNWQVKEGQLLVQLDPRDYQAKVDQAKAALSVAGAQANAAQAGVPLTRATTTSGTSGAEAQLGAAQADYERARVAAQQARTSGVAVAQAAVAQAQANNQKAQTDLARMQPLLAKAEISQQQFDAFRAAADVSAAQLRSAEEQLAAARQTASRAAAAEQSAAARVKAAQAGLAESRAGQQQVTVTAAQAKSASASVQQAQANLEAAELQLSYCNIYSPADGEVTQKTLEPGQIVQPGQGLMVIVPLRDVWVTANFKETQLAEVRPGQKAEVQVDMYGTGIEGRVDSIAGATGARTSLLPPENATGNYVKVVQRIPVKIMFEKGQDPEHLLRLGMSVEPNVKVR